jgi:peptidoglycan L-alanyl-D-glutamate endopeptidase CwlK
MAIFSDKSKILLSECDIKLQKVCNLAIELMDFTVLTGYRNQEAQERAVADGNSKLIFPNGKHNSLPSQAVDLAPFPIDWSDKDRFMLLAGIMLGIASIHRIKLRWGGNWNGDFNLKANKFADLGHFELVV